MVRAADKVLSIVVATGVDRILRSAAPTEVDELVSGGVFMLNARPEDGEDSDEDAMQELGTDDTTLVQVDALKVLRDSVARFGFSLGATTQGFVELRHADLPSDCAVYFLLSNSRALYAIRALAKVSALIVLHVNDDIVDHDENTFLHPLGVHAARLRTLESLDAATIEQLVRTLQAAYTASSVALGTPPTAAAAPSADPAQRAHSEIDPLRLPEYASTGQEQLFELATACVLEPMFQWLLPLGMSFSGRQVPDGVVFRSSARSAKSPPEVAHYDCKSKEKDAYDLAPGDGDQQERYLEIQRRLEEERGWVGRGVLMFTPEVDPDVIARKTQKEAWARVLADNRELIFVPAQVLRRWWELQRLERAWQLRSLVCPTLIWSALFDGTLPGIPTAVARRLLPVQRGVARLLDVAAAELIWLAGLHAFPEPVLLVAGSLQAADPEATIEEKLRLPALMEKYVAALGQKGATLASLAQATGLQSVGVEYLLRSQDLTKRLTIDLGRHHSENLQQLRIQLDKALRGTGA